MSRRIIDPVERKEQQPRPVPKPPRHVLRPLVLDTRLNGDVYETIPCSRPECSALAVATSDPDARVCEEHV